MKKDLLLLGAGGHCCSCIDVIEQEGRFSIAGIVDKTEAGIKAEAGVLGYPLLGTDDDLPGLRKKYDYALVTVGQINSPTIRRRLFDKLHELGFELPVIISPLAYVSRHASIDQGTIIMHQALINAGAKIGANCIINTKALVEHDAVIEYHCHIATGAIINGGAYIGTGCFIGSSSTIKEGVTLIEDCLVGMGLSVRDDQPQGARIVS